MMSEIARTPVNTPKSYTRIIIAIMSVMILLLVYGAGTIIFPVSILSVYQDKNCSSVLSLNNIYSDIYPFFLQDKTLSAQVGECEAYLLAISHEEAGNWSEAFDAYQGYLDLYPGGLYAVEAYEHRAIVLMEVAKSKITQKKIDEALADLNQIISSYSDAGVSADAFALFVSTYTSRGTDLRSSGDFDAAERVFNDFRSWAQNNQKTDLGSDIQGELAQTYLAWGLALQSQDKYEEALAKFDMAESADPEPNLDSGYAAQAKAGRVGVYIQWGNDFVEQAEFATAIERFEVAVSLADGNNLNDAKDALANGHVQWAQRLSADEDFRGALEQMELAREAAVTDAMNQSVDTALEDIYVDFSNSTGSQARRAMMDALEAVCKQNKTPDLPIFGLNKDTIHVGLYGIDGQLPEDVVAKTPGEMHYVVCVEVEKHTVEAEKGYYWFVNPGGGFTTIPTTWYRVQLSWDVSLRKSDTGEEYATKAFDGGTPPPFPEKFNDRTSINYEGSLPETFILIEWLKSVIE